MGTVTDLVPSPAPAVFQPALFTPTPKAAKRVLEFFTAQIDNDHTRKAYLNATRRFAAWCDVKGIHQLADVHPFHVAAFMRTTPCLFVLAIGATALHAQPAKSAMDSVLLKDWTPDSSLVVPVTDIPKARYPAIDVHIHIGRSGTGLSGGDTAESLAAWMSVMDAVFGFLRQTKTAPWGEEDGSRRGRRLDVYWRHAGCQNGNPG